MISSSAASYAAFPQPGLWQSDLAAAAMSAVLRVAAAEDSSRQCCSLLVSGLSCNSVKLDGREADSFGYTSFGSAIAQSELTAIQAGKLPDLQRLSAGSEQTTHRQHAKETQFQCFPAVQDLQACQGHAAYFLLLFLADLERSGG